jgi:uncharacterized membrane protein YdjX (TVP38/TMEM64 family)
MSDVQTNDFQKRLRYGLVALVALMLFVAYRVGLFSYAKNPAALAAALRDLGPVGYLLFVVTYALFQPFGVPGTAFVLAAPLIWPWPVAFALSMAGSVCASSVGFSFARFVARDWVTARLPERFRKYEAELERRAFLTVVTLRFLFWMPPMLHAFFGVSRVSFRTHFFGSLLGYIVPLLVLSYFGEKVFVWLRAQPPSLWLGLGAAGFVLGCFVVWHRRTRTGAERRETRRGG